MEVGSRTIADKCDRDGHRRNIYDLFAENEIEIKSMADKGTIYRRRRREVRVEPIRDSGNQAISAPHKCC